MGYRCSYLHILCSRNMFLSAFLHSTNSGTIWFRFLNEYPLSNPQLTHICHRRAYVLPSWFLFGNHRWRVSPVPPMKEDRLLLLVEMTAANGSFPLQAFIKLFVWFTGGNFHDVPISSCQLTCQCQKIWDLFCLRLGQIIYCRRNPHWWEIISKIVYQMIGTGKLYLSSFLEERRNWIDIHVVLKSRHRRDAYSSRHHKSI